MLPQSHNELPDCGGGCGLGTEQGFPPYFSASQHFPHPLPPLQTSVQEHPPVLSSPHLSPLAVHSLVPVPASALLCFLLWLLPPLTACETPREARNSSSNIKIWDYIKNGSVCNVQCNQLREGSYNSIRRTGGTAQALGSLLCLLKTPHQALLLPFRGLLSSHATCQQLLSPVKCPGTKQSRGDLFQCSFVYSILFQFLKALNTQARGILAAQKSLSKLHREIIASTQITEKQ